MSNVNAGKRLPAFPSSLRWPVASVSAGLQFGEQGTGFFRCFARAKNKAREPLSSFFPRSQSPFNFFRPRLVLNRYLHEDDLVQVYLL